MIYLFHYNDDYDDEAEEAGNGKGGILSNGSTLLLIPLVRIPSGLFWSWFSLGKTGHRNLYNGRTYLSYWASMYCERDLHFFYFVLLVYDTYPTLVKLGSYLAFRGNSRYVPPRLGKELSTKQQ